MAATCTWKWSNRYIVWQTACGVELSESDRDELLGDYYATNCPWCGGLIDSEKPDDMRTEADVEREEMRALERDYWKEAL